jgi:cytoskeletal protein CcmA (bactofilin family)
MSADRFLEAMNESLIGEGVKLEGKLIFQGTMKLAGSFEGEIFTADKLIIMETAQVKANIEGDTIIIAGKVEGNIQAKSKIEIRASGYFKGTILTPILSIEEGGIFEGASYMSATYNQI